VAVSEVGVELLPEGMEVSSGVETACVEATSSVARRTAFFESSASEDTVASCANPVACELRDAVSWSVIAGYVTCGSLETRV
jgi:hypothetical protein